MASIVPEDVQQWIYNQIVVLGYNNVQLCFQEILHVLNEFSWLRPRTDYTPMGLLLVLYGSNAQISVPLIYPLAAPLVEVNGVAQPGKPSIRDTVLTLLPPKPPKPPIKAVNSNPPVPPKPPKPPKQPDLSVPEIAGSGYKPPVPSKSGPFVPMPAVHNMPQNGPQSVIPNTQLNVPKSISHSIPHSIPVNTPPNLPQSVPQSIPQHLPEVPKSLPDGTTQHAPQKEPPAIIDLMNSLEIRTTPPPSLIEKLKEIPPPEFRSVEEDKRTLAQLQTQLDRYESQLLVDKQTHQANIHALGNAVKSAKKLISDVPPPPTDVSELVKVHNIAAEQSLAADQAIQDLLDLLPRALDSGSISLQVYLRIVRQYAREQFVHRQSRIPSRPPKQAQLV